MKRLRISIKNKHTKNQGVAHDGGKGFRLCLNDILQTEWIIVILIQLSVNIFPVTFKMESDWLPAEKKQR